MTLSLPPFLWLTLQAAALWPSLVWAARRMADGSDERLGLVALLVLALGVASGRVKCRSEPRLSWLAAAMTLTAAATVLGASVPPLAVAMVSALALGAAAAAFRAPHTPWLPVAGLLLLALPLIASLQFYAGWPLRVLTAEASRWLLLAGAFDATRIGTALLVDGREVLVDAPCSGVQLAWLAWCTACTSALWHRLEDTRFLACVPLAGVIALIANVLRNTALVAIVARTDTAPAWLHEAIGLVVVAAVVIAVDRLMREQGDAR